MVLRNLSDLVELYLSEDRPALERERERLRGMFERERALAAVASLRDARGRYHRHQWRLPRRVKAAVGEALGQLTLEGLGSFEDLQVRLDKQLGRLEGAGDTTRYDLALRLSFHLGLEPRRVHLHGASREAAAHLGIRGAAVDPQAFPQELRRLAPWELEHALELHRDALEHLTPHGRRASLTLSIARALRPKAA